MKSQQIFFKTAHNCVNINLQMHYFQKVLSKKMTYTEKLPV